MREKSVFFSPETPRFYGIFMPEHTSEPKQNNSGTPSVSHIERILHLLTLMQSGWFTQEELFQHFSNISKRTFYRDLEAIRSFFGNQIQSDAAKKLYFVPKENFRFQSLELSYLELLSLYLICQIGISQPHRIPYLTHLEPVLLKIQNLSRGLIEPMGRISELRTGMEVGPTSSGSGNRWLKVLLEAQEKKLEVFVEYDSLFDGQVIQTSLAPFYLHFNRRAWYVTGRSKYHHEVRTFNIERFLRVELLPDQPFFIPVGWDYEQYRGNAWNMIQDREDSAIRLRFSSLVARNVSEVQWHKTQRVIENGDGTIDVLFTVSGFREIVWWILGYGPEVEVLEPPALRELVRTQAEKMLSIYRQNDPPQPAPPETHVPPENGSAPMEAAESE